MSDYDARVMAALKRMAVYRQAETGPQTFAAFTLALADARFEVEDIESACRDLERAARAEGETAFPSLGTLRGRIDKAARLRRSQSRALAALPSGPDEPTFRCFNCQDDPSGWLVLRCPGDLRCERDTPHGDHDYAVRCPHWLRDRTEELTAAARETLQSGHRVGAAAESLYALNRGDYRYERVVSSVMARARPQEGP